MCRFRYLALCRRTRLIHSIGWELSWHQTEVICILWLFVCHNYWKCYLLILEIIKLLNQWTLTSWVKINDVITCEFIYLSFPYSCIFSENKLVGKCARGTVVSIVSCQCAYCCPDTNMQQNNQDIYFAVAYCCMEKHVNCLSCCYEFGIWLCVVNVQA